MQKDGQADEFPAHKSGARRRGGIFAILGILALAGVGFAALQYWPTLNNRPVKSASAPTAIPVTTGKTGIRDMSIERSALGTVTALSTVTVRTRVDGQLLSLSFQEGQDVKVGDVLARIDPRPYEAELARVQATLAKDSAQLTVAKADYDRASKLSSSGYGAVQIADTAKGQVAILEATIAGDQAAIDTAKLNLDFSTINAPVSGRVGLKLVDEGSMLHVSDTAGLVTITKMKPIAVEFSLQQDDLPDLLAGQNSGELSVAVDSRDGQQHLADGKITAIDSQVDPNTGMIKLKATFPNESLSLWPGELVTARVVTRTDRNMVAAPAAAIQNGQNGPYVFVVKPDNKVAAVPVEAGLTAGGYTALKSGIAPEQEIVVGGQSRLSDGALITVKNAGSNVASTSESKP
ncbi:efflux RND transporter periplasmic adaptor subunit [Phyllobacterium sp. OV277]|uniref:efflux RND transporter periplasmic adaptor subunit n=1 Tax=Phyllobacterium sp. OV277 TaxID=1882772 RepID=UPI00244E8DFD|nr:efflux RND transporter periplasmic adaptor subunit [Phyllobacterium sp. OV277]